MPKWTLIILALLASFAVLPASAHAADLPCVVDAPGFDPDRAATAAMIGCGALIDEGVSVDVRPVSDAPGAHARLRLMRLDALVLVELLLIDDDGEADIRRTTIQTLDELPVAAPRLARALVRGESFDATARHDNIVAGEARELRTIDGEFFFGAGLQSTWVPGMSVIGAGAGLSAMYEADDFAVTTTLRMTGMSQGDESLFNWQFLLGGRYLVGEGNTAFFVGGGLGFGGIHAETHDPWDEYSTSDRELAGDGFGLLGYGEIGVETLRFYGTRLVIDLHVELPMYLLEGEAWVETGGKDEWGYPNGHYEDRDYYVVPLGLGATWLF